jgi:hypothetical protein
MTLQLRRLPQSEEKRSVLYTVILALSIVHTVSGLRQTLINHSVDDACNLFGMYHKNNIYPDNRK